MVNEMERYYTAEIPKSERIPKMVEHLYAKLPEIESARAILLTESYKATEGEPIMMRRAKAFAPHSGQYSHHHQRWGTCCGKYHDCPQRMPDVS